ncbi:MAG: hypothetical protein MUC83_06000 [Pirellula sp.]|jgi:hypothetical protein|nr:hypothetical protein [Pirellula sp.]
METVKHVLSFVANANADMLTVHLDIDGIALLMERLSVLKELIERGQCEDSHLFTTDSIGSELSSTKLIGQSNEVSIVHHVKLCAWTKEWAEKHRLVPVPLASIEINPFKAD